MATSAEFKRSDLLQHYGADADTLLPRELTTFIPRMVTGIQALFQCLSPYFPDVTSWLSTFALPVIAGDRSEVGLLAPGGVILDPQWQVKMTAVVEEELKSSPRLRHLPTKPAHTRSLERLDNLSLDQLLPHSLPTVQVVFSFLATAVPECWAACKVNLTVVGDSLLATKLLEILRKPLETLRKLLETLRQLLETLRKLLEILSRYVQLGCNGVMVTMHTPITDLLGADYWSAICKYEPVTVVLHPVTHLIDKDGEQITCQHNIDSFRSLVASFTADPCSVGTIVMPLHLEGRRVNCCVDIFPPSSSLLLLGAEENGLHLRTKLEQPLVGQHDAWQSKLFEDPGQPDKLVSSGFDYSHSHNVMLAGLWQCTVDQGEAVLPADSAEQRSLHSAYFDFVRCQKDWQRAAYEGYAFVRQMAVNSAEGSADT